MKEDSSGKLCDKMPSGYEIYENPNNAQVSLRKESEKIISDIESHIVKKAVKVLNRRANYIVDVKNNEIVIHESETSPAYDEGLISKLGFGALRSEFSYSNDKKNNDPDLKSYMAVMKFKLVDDKKRSFLAFRYCFRGAIDGWIRLGGPANLSQLVDKYIEILGTDKFYESPYF